MIFYLGTHEVGWLGKTTVPLFLAAPRLRLRRNLPKASTSWALDSGGYSEIRKHGRWSTTDTQYAREIKSWFQAGGLKWAAPRDWMCDPESLKRTGLPLRVHQDLTIASVLELRKILGTNLVVPVLQGWAADDYLRHADAYERAGIELRKESVVGVGSIVSRQHDPSVRDILAKLWARGYARFVASADSLAWSFDARRAKAIAGHSHKNCANCLEYALRWRDRVQRAIREAA